jgi:hypothetical protein
MQKVQNLQAPFFRDDRNNTDYINNYVLLLYSSPINDAKPYQFQGLPGIKAQRNLH